MTDTTLPPTPMQSAGTALASGAQDMVATRMRRAVKRKLPRFLHPLIPGEGGTVREAAGKQAKRAVSRWISGVLFSIFFFTVFFGLVAAILTFTVGAVVWALMMG